MLASAVKAYMAVQLHEHASNPTDRTPQNTYHLSKSLFFVESICLVVASITCLFVYAHNGTVASPIVMSNFLFAGMHYLFNQVKYHD